METINFVISGLGGQGVLFLTKILAHAALNKGLRVMGAETHGMAQRGGSVISHLRLGDVESSLVRTGSASILLALEEHEAYRNLPYLSKGAGMYVNADSKGFPRKEVKGFLDQREISYHAVQAGAMALDLRAPLSSNLALLGYFSAFVKGPVTREELRTTIQNISPDRFREINLKVFDAGLEEGKKEL